jgi:tetratricopeptide (TPR) repeat protein
MRFSDIFGKPKPNDFAPASPAPEPSKATQTVVLPQQPADRPPTPPQTVRVFDEFGRELMVPIETWRTQILPDAIAKAGDDADRLYGLIVDALQLRLAADVLPAAKRLIKIDRNPERGVTIYGIVLMESGHPTTALTLFETYLAQHGVSGVVFTNLAKTQIALGLEQEANATLWRALEADPNQQNGLAWFAARERDRAGEPAWLAAIKRVAHLPGAWLPQMWMANAALNQGDHQAALALYGESLNKAGSPVPLLLLQSISGDLGKAGLLEDAIALTQPAFDPKLHGLAVGNNLIKASLDLGRLPQANAILEQLYSLGRPDWADNLNFWEAEIRRKQFVSDGPLPEPTVTMLSIEGPVWLPSSATSRDLFPQPAASGVKIIFLGSSVRGSAVQDFFHGKLPDDAGRLSRSLPLFLAESAYLHFGLDVTTLFPFVERSGFAVVAEPWTITAASAYAQNAGATWAIVTHIDIEGERTAVTLRVISAAEPPATAFEITIPVSLQQPGDDALTAWSQLAPQLLQLLIPPPTSSAAARYILPQGQALSAYLLRLEQLFAVRCAGMDGIPAKFLSGIREILRGELNLALSTPNSLPVRLILHETLLRIRELSANIAAEFRQPVETLQQRYPLADPTANAVLQQQLRSICL